MAKPKSPFLQKVEFTLIRTLFLIVKILPFTVSGWLGRQLGAYSFRLIRSRRKLTIENIREARVRGFLPPDTRDIGLGQKVWEHLSLMAMEFAYYYNAPPEKILQDVTLEGSENLRRVLEKKQGVVLVTTHVGNWELMGMALAKAWFVANSIVQAQSNSIWDQYINERRRSIGLKVIRKKGFLRPIVEAFKRNEIVSFFIDQNAGKGGIPIKVMGREAGIPRGAAEFALLIRGVGITLPNSFDDIINFDK
jgi:Kdo2-lipid IVA lauroyltransferase/acyltransferase